tara:strand:+ start:368 stop:1621 length:1254 start_codon:yes stop_codon:yes gene_type:complete
MDREAILEQDAEAYLLQESSQRRFLYRDVEELIEIGFLRHTLVFDGIPVTFRSLLPQDVTRFQARIHYTKTREDILRWSLAASVWMVDGFELPLDPKSNTAYHVYTNWLEDVPASVIINLAVVTTGFQNRLGRATRLVEAFCYEPYSRSLWRMLGRPVTDLKNSSLIRRMWVAHNIAEDENKADDREWSRTQSIVASMSNKAAKHIRKSIQTQDEKEENRRQRVIEDAVNWVIRGDEPEEVLTVMVNGEAVEVPRIHSAQTVEDLETEMRRVFSGEKDFHDMLVDEYHASIRQRTIDKREARKQAILEARARADAREVETGVKTSLVGYTREQLAQFRPAAVRPKTTATVSESAQEQHMFGRYFAPEIRPGVLTPGLKVEEAQRIDKPEAEEDSKESPLQAKISRRRPQFKPGSEGG